LQDQIPQEVLVDLDLVVKNNGMVVEVVVVDHLDLVQVVVWDHILLHMLVVVVVLRLDLVNL
tara:strand:+ start:331 stop:516 length:186 start_codon:yes stop_codon:yes gene_type:complete